MKEEDNILKKVGKENVFRVPDGYFENLTSEVMSRLPEKETPAIIKRTYEVGENKAMGIYDCHVCRCSMIIRVASTDRTPVNNRMAMDEPETEVVSDEYISAVLDNSMLDDYSLYVYLTDAGAESDVSNNLTV